MERSEVSRRGFLKRIRDLSVAPGLRAIVPEYPEVEESENEFIDEILELLYYLYYLKMELSKRKNDIHPEILHLVPGTLPNFNEIPGIIEARQNSNLEERVLQVIRELSVNTSEEMNVFVNEKFYEQRKGKLEGLMEKLDLISKSKKDGYHEEKLDSLYEEVYQEFLKLTDFIDNYREKLGNPAWNGRDIAYCNLYATVFFEALGLGHRISHRVDELNRPIKRGGRELSAEATHNWLKTFGTRYGWKEVTNISYEEKLEMLGKGYIFYGSTKEHNWIIFGIKINGRVIPCLSQATENINIGFFLTRSISTKTTDQRIIDKINEAEDEYYEEFEDRYKLLCNEEGATLHAINLEDSKNPQI